MKKKINIMNSLYQNDGPRKHDDFKYQNIWGLKKFNGTHPKLVIDWITNNRNDIDINNLDRKFEYKNIGLFISDIIEELTDYRIGEYKNYNLL